MKTQIWVTCDMPGVHSWPEAPEHLHFLKHAHRHVFKFKIGVTVTKHDRQLEFFELQNELANTILNLFEQDNLVLQFGNYSCEMIAQDILDQLVIADYVEVSEDGENGAIIWR